MRSFFLQVAYIKARTVNAVWESPEHRADALRIRLRARDLIWLYFSKLSSRWH